MNFDVHSSQDLFLPLKAKSYGWWETMPTGGKDEMDELFPVKWSKDDPVEDIGEGNEDKEKEGGQGQASSKRQRTEVKQEDTQEYEKSVHVKREDVDEIDLDIDFGNMSKSGKLNGGGDAVAQFEHDWKEDRDQVRLAPQL